MRVGEVWGDFLKSAPTIARKIAEAKVVDVWPLAAGMTVAMYTQSVRVVKGVAYIQISSAAARHEAFTQRRQLLEKINRLLEMDVLTNIIIK